MGRAQEVRLGLVHSVCDHLCCFLLALGGYPHHTFDHLLVSDLSGQCLRSDLVCKEDNRHISFLIEQIIYTITTSAAAAIKPTAIWHSCQISVSISIFITIFSQIVNTSHCTHTHTVHTPQCTHPIWSCYQQCREMEHAIV